MVTHLLRYVCVKPTGLNGDIMGWIIECQLHEMTDLAWNDTSQTWEINDYDTYDNEDVKTMTLPIGGKFVKVPWEKYDDIQ